AITAIIDCTDGSVAYKEISNAVLVCGASNVDNKPMIFKYASCSSFVNVGNCFTSLAIFTSSAFQLLPTNFLYILYLLVYAISFQFSIPLDLPPKSPVDLLGLRGSNVFAISSIDCDIF